jgi:diguanylate cyclase (GGDEF)-like protein
VNNNTDDVSPLPESGSQDSLEKDTPAKNVTTRLRLLFLTPLAVAIVLIVFVLSMMLYLQANHDVRESVIRVRTTAQDFYDESIRYDASVLKTIMHTLTYDKNLSTALAQQDRKALLQYSKPLFEGMKRDFNITHFYFTGTDRVNLLRAHAPLRNGDVIDRRTTLQAESSGTINYGVELGPLGTFTLRLVSPWYDQQTRELIGYVELGMEIDHVINKIREFFGVQIFTVIKKEYLDRQKWENGMRTLGRTPHWDRYSDIVASGQEMTTIPNLLTERLVHGELLTNSGIMDLSYRGLSYRLTVLPLQDAAGRDVARMMLLTDVSSEEAMARQTVFAGTIAALIVGTALLIFFYWLVGRIGRRLERTEKKLRELATRDGLTGLLNHRVFYTNMQEECERSRRYKHAFSLLMIDIDHFKKVNDTYGHPAGDEILRSLSKLLQSRMRSIDSIFRYGGEEITIMLLETDTPTAKTIGEEIRNIVEKESFKIDNGQFIHITISIGLSSFPNHADEVSQLVLHADSALYEAKEDGRNRLCVYQPKST